jgi:hypothetical protein
VFTADFDTTKYAVIASVTSMTPRGDRTCVLTPENADRHPFIHHESYVYYGAMLEVEMDRLRSTSVTRPSLHAYSHEFAKARNARLTRSAGSSAGYKGHSTVALATM